MPQFVVDIESDGLLDTVTKIHVVGWLDIATGKNGTITDYSKMIRFFTQKDLTIIGHNFYRFDKPLVEMILGIKLEAKIVDTLFISWYLEPERLKHGLEFYGEDFGIPKPKVVDWTEQPIEVYINRVVEDVKINTRLFLNQIKYLNNLYPNKEDSRRLVRYLMFKAECALEQEEVKWRLDSVKCKADLALFEAEFERKTALLSDAMPEAITYRTLNKPKGYFKKDGSLTKKGEDWEELLLELGYDPVEHNAPIKLEKTREKGNPGSTDQLKNWLLELGWTPATFKYDKETKRPIPQISLPQGKGLCWSVKRLYDVEPILQELDMFYVIKHRIGLLKGFLRDVDDKGYLQAKVSGLTNTLRFKHSVIVNLPKYTGRKDWKDGEHIRGCLIAPEGMILCGSDMSSLEDRTKQHYMHFFDPDYVKEMNTPGFDPHLNLAEFAYEMTNGEMGVSPSDIEWYKGVDENEVLIDFVKKRYQKIKEERNTFKTVNYGAVYGAGAPTMSRSSGMPVAKCKFLLEAYWQKNWSVKKIARACIVKTLTYPTVEYNKKSFYDAEGKLIKIEVVKENVIKKQMWLYNPVSRFWYSLRYDKDRFSTLNQGTGVFIFDNYVKGARQLGIKLCGQFHDEIVFPLKLGEEAPTTKKLRSVIQKINSTMNLNREMGVDIQFGNNYSQIH